MRELRNFTYAQCNTYGLMTVMGKGVEIMIKAVIFDMFETLITHYQSPLYFGTQMAQDSGISNDKFQALWAPTESDRPIGNLTLEEVLEKILKENQCYSAELLNKLVKKRISAKEECFNHLNPQIIPMLKEIKSQGLKIGLISNCFSEEAPVIKSSILYPYFDKAYLSYEQGIQKPDREIFTRCMKGLGVEAEECIYVGDGGSFELEAASELLMKPIQAVWYLKHEYTPVSRLNSDFTQAESPLDIIRYIKMFNAAES